MVRSLKELLIGSPLHTASLHEQRLTKKAALPILASDNLSSSAYATEEIVRALVAAVAVGVVFPLYYAIPIALAIGLLTAIVAISYGQTLHAYPTGGGAYTVAKENLGVLPALVAGSSLLVDYVLTVAVSVAAGIAAITSAALAICGIAFGETKEAASTRVRPVRESRSISATFCSSGRIRASF